MSNIKKLIVLVTLLLCACTTTHELSPEWAPLEKMVDRPGSGNMLTTVGSTVWAADLDKWLKRNPVGSPTYRASLAHERVHAVRQKRVGLARFIKNYTLHRSYRWYEEQLGWYVELKVLQSYGVLWYVEAIAVNLESYSPSLGSKSRILKWLQDVSMGRWKPNPEDLPADYRKL